MLKFAQLREMGKKSYEDCFQSKPLRKAIQDRYGTGNEELLRDRVREMQQLVAIAEGAYIACDSDTKRRKQGQQMLDDQKDVVVVCSPGRDRIFMGHTDFLGLGGFTLDVATSSEIMSLSQLTKDGIVYLYNADPRYPVTSFDIKDVFKTALKCEEHWGKRVYDPAEWASYIQGMLCYMLCKRFPCHEQVRKALGLIDEESSPSVGMRFVASSTGLCALPTAGGVSSSAALTGSFVTALDHLLTLHITKNELAMTDYGEYFLGKHSGAADKTAQLHAKRGEFVAVGSLPVKCLRQNAKNTFPSQHLVVLLANCPTPRLSGGNAKQWLKNESGLNYNEDECELVYNWGHSIMQRFGSLSLKKAAETLSDHLRQVIEGTYKGCDCVSVEEANIVQSALHYEENQRAYKGPLLRELAAGGSLELHQLGSSKLLDALAGEEGKEKRYNLIYRLLKLLPESWQEEGFLGGRTSCLRKVALYGISEVERGMSYLANIDTMNESASATDVAAAKDRVLELARMAHNGDRATVDYRKMKPNALTDKETGCGLSSFFEHTAWHDDKRNDVSDATLDHWSKTNKPLTSAQGGFERSLPEIDEMADDLDRVFNRVAALRVSAAGLGGNCTIHVETQMEQTITQYLEERSWSVRRVTPGAPTQRLQLTGPLF